MFARLLFTVCCLLPAIAGAQTYNSVTASPTLLPTLTGATGPTTWITAAKTFGGAALDSTSSPQTLVLGNTWWGNLYYKPTTVAAGVACIFEIGGSTSGHSLWRDGDDLVWVCSRSGVNNKVTKTDCLAAGTWINVQFYVLPSSMGIATNGTTAVTGTNGTWSSDGNDPGGIGGVNGFAVNPSYVAVTTGQYTSADIAGLRIKAAVDGSGYAGQVYAGPEPTYVSGSDTISLTGTTLNITPGIVWGVSPGSNGTISSLYDVYINGSIYLTDSALTSIDLSTQLTSGGEVVTIVSSGTNLGGVDTTQDRTSSGVTYYLGAGAAFRYYQLLSEQ